MDQLIKTLPAIVAAAGASAELLEAAAIAAWNYTVGPGLGEQTKALRLVEGKLTVAVRDKVWQKQLESMRGELRPRLNSILGQALVTLIEFSVEPDLLQQSQVSAKRSNLGEQPVPLDLLAAVTAIKDSKLRNSFVAAAVSSIRRLEASPSIELES